jgi:hypothetical protein
MRSSVPALWLVDARVFWNVKLMDRTVVSFFVAAGTAQTVSVLFATWLKMAPPLKSA